MTVTVTTLRYHTHRGDEHQPGDRYEVDEADVANLQALGMATTAPVETDDAPQKKTAKKNS